jgi:hypothetical protein
MDFNPGLNWYLQHEVNDFAGKIQLIPDETNMPLE